MPTVVVDLPADAPPALVADDAEGLRAPPEGTLRWIDIEQPTAELLETLREPFGLHPLAIEDCLTFDQRPKLEEYPNHLFVVIHELELDGMDLSGNELHAFLHENFLITVRAEPCDALVRLRERIVRENPPHVRDPGFIYYLIADAVSDRNHDVLDALAEEIDTIEEQVVHHQSTHTLPKLFRSKRALSRARRLLSPARDLFAALTKFENEAICHRTALYFRDVYDKLVRANESIEANRELVSNTLEAHFSVISQRTNEIMKSLTLLSAVFMPLTFVTGFFGQNFAAMPFQSPAVMWFAFASCLLLPALMLFWFRKKRWL